MCRHSAPTKAITEQYSASTAVYGLIDRIGPCGVVVSMPALRMRDSDPPRNFRECAVVPRSEQQMPVIRRQAIGGDMDLGSSVGFRQNLLKGDVVNRFFKQGEASHTTI